MIRSSVRSGSTRLSEQTLGAALRGISSLVLAEHAGGRLQPNTHHVVTAALKVGGPVTVLVAGLNVKEVGNEASKLAGIESVLLADEKSLEHSLAEPTAALLAAVQKKRNFTHIVAPSSTFGRNILPRAAALLNSSAVADVTDVVGSDTFRRPIYAGNALETVKVVNKMANVICFSARPTAFQPIGTQTNEVMVESVEEDEITAATSATGACEWVEKLESVSERPQLGQAKIVVSGGRALKSKENFQLIEELADVLGGAVGASRAAVDAGYVPNDLQVGQTGKVVAPDLYMAVGISGAIQHIAGMKDSKVIVAINSDQDAPIFQISDYGLVGDLFQILPELLEELKKAKQT